MNHVLPWVLALGSQTPEKDLIQLKNGEIIEAKVLKFDDKGIQIQFSGGQEIFYAYEQINAYSAYDIRRKRMNKTSAEDHLAMADLSRRLGLVAYALSHLREASERAPERKEEFEKIQRELKTEDAKQKFKAAKDLVDKKTDKAFDSAAKLLHEIIEKYEDTPYYEDAKKLESRLAEDVAKLRKERDAEREKEAKAREARRKEAENKDYVDRGAALISEGQKLWMDGLDKEAANFGRQAHAVWEQAVSRLALAKATIDAAIKAAKDPDILRRLADEGREADRWLVRVYLSIARLLAADNLDFAGAMRWINSSLKIDPENQGAIQLKLTITEAVIRGRLDASTIRPPTK